MNTQDARRASADFIRSLDPDARRLWEMAGPHATDIDGLEAWAIRAAGDRPRVVVVQIMGARNENRAGWLTFAEIGPNDIEGTREAFRRLPEIERPAPGPGAPPAPFGELLEAALDLRAAVARFEDDPDLDAAKARADAAIDAMAEAGFRVVIAPAGG
jgi:hypothetical protein